jgi:hypothetical protein
LLAWPEFRVEKFCDDLAEMNEIEGAIHDGEIGA